MALYSRPIKAPRTIPDGEYYSVMSRHTLSDGVTPDVEIAVRRRIIWSRSRRQLG